MVKRKLRNDEAKINKPEGYSEEIASDSAGQSGDDQGLSQTAQVDEESVRELREARTHA